MRHECTLGCYPKSHYLGKMRASQSSGAAVAGTGQPLTGSGTIRMCVARREQDDDAGVRLCPRSHEELDAGAICRTGTGSIKVQQSTPAMACRCENRINRPHNDSTLLRPARLPAIQRPSSLCPQPSSIFSAQDPGPGCGKGAIKLERRRSPSCAFFFP